MYAGLCVCLAAYAALRVRLAAYSAPRACPRVPFWTWARRSLVAQVAVVRAVRRLGNASGGRASSEKCAAK
eukprot:6450064-Alexandrium_andersonii.AAC.1